ncbi:hypothetical protein [Nocardioides sp.]|uniref:hypothetical protein n=1 Tax=Nocardioides sp. TaxID=35761 RepID=UPI0035120452
MTWCALLLLGWAATDLAFSATRRPRLAEALGAATVLGGAALIGIGPDSSGPQVVAVIVLAVLVVAWGESVTLGFGRRRPLLPLAVAGGSLLGVLLVAGHAPDAGGPWRTWVLDAAPRVIADLGPDRALAVLGAVAVQFATGNVLVRLVLAVSGTTHPLRSAHHPLPASPLKGGRLLGPLERVFLLGLGLAGDLTAAGVVIAAKGLLRFPELQAARRPARGRTTPDIHEITEYFLVGSFVSWSVAFTALVLVA